MTDRKRCARSGVPLRAQRFFMQIGKWKVDCAIFDLFEREATKFGNAAVAPDRRKRALQGELVCANVHLANDYRLGDLWYMPAKDFNVPNDTTAPSRRTRLPSMKTIVASPIRRRTAQRVPGRDPPNRYESPSVWNHRLPDMHEALASARAQQTLEYARPHESLATRDSGNGALARRHPLGEIARFGAFPKTAGTMRS